MIMCVCMCVCACVCACVRACVCVCMCVYYMNEIFVFIIKIIKSQTAYLIDGASFEIKPTITDHVVNRASKVLLKTEKNWNAIKKGYGLI